MSSEEQSTSRKFPWYIIGPIIGLIGVSIAVYINWFHDSSPRIEIQILSKTKILDIKEPVAGLDVLLDSVSLIETNQELEVIVARLINVGESDVAIIDYDTSALVGFTILNGNTIERPKVLEASNTYLTSPRRIRSGEENGVLLEPSILNKGDFITVKIFVLSSADEQTEIVAKGIITGGGVPELVFKSEIEGPDKLSELERILGVLVMVLIFVGIINVVLATKEFFDSKRDLKEVVERNEEMKARLSSLVSSLKEMQDKTKELENPEDAGFEEDLDDVRNR